MKYCPLGDYPVRFEVRSRLASRLHLNEEHSHQLSGNLIFYVTVLRVGEVVSPDSFLPKHLLLLPPLPYTHGIQPLG